MNILVVDDAKDIRLIIKSVLEKLGHTVTTAGDGEEAWTLLQDGQDFQIVISDWMMPRLDGLGLCERIRNEAFPNYIYIILLTGMSGRTNLISGIAAGADDFANKPINSEDAFLILEAAQSVSFVPGYGMAVAQAQHVVRELGELLEKNGAEVTYAIHPVAGRMPGHMNVLLAEANVPYDQLVEMEDINPRIDKVDVAVVIGANDVVNPAARNDENSPIYGMPIINVDQAQTVFVLKRSMASGFSGVDNPLFFGDNTRMLFGDAKQSIAAVVAEFKT